MTNCTSESKPLPIWWLTVAEHYEGNEFDGTCPCCMGALEWPDTFDLCDGCIAAALDDVWPHGCPGDAVRKPFDPGSTP